MMGLILRRLAILPVILFVIYTITFVLAWVMPGDPLQADEARQPPPEVARAMREQYRLDSGWSFYWDYLAKASGVRWALSARGPEGGPEGGPAAADASPGPPRGADEKGTPHAKRDLSTRSSAFGDPKRPIFDLGPSLRHENWTVNEILRASLPISVTLGIAALLIASVLGLAAGVIGAVRPGSWLDLATLGLALLGISLPTFVIGAGLLILFGVWLSVVPIGGWGSLSHMTLPAVTLALPFAAYIARLTRAAMFEQLGSDHIRTARAKGLPEHQVVIKHALKNAFLPVLSFLGPAAAAALTGSFVVEVIFAVPGIGVHFVDAVLSKDLTLIMGVVLVYSAMLILFNLAVDVLYRWIDPRIT